MADFLLIIPEGWTQINLELATQVPGISIAGIENWIANNQMEYITSSLVDAGFLPAGSAVVDAKLFNGTTFAVLLG